MKKSFGIILVFLILLNANYSIAAQTLGNDKNSKFLLRTKKERITAEQRLEYLNIKW